MPFRVTPATPPPLAARPPAVRTRIRALLWRGRAPVAAACLALAVTAAVGALRPPDPATVSTLVVARDLDAGARLTEADLRVVQLPRAVAVAAAASGPQDVLGATTAVPLSAGTPVVPGVLVESVTGPAGTVVAAVRFADDAVAAYLRPGDRVDVVAATPDGGPGGTLASRALVLPGRDVSGDGAAGGLLGTEDADAGPVLLAVTADEALALAGATGGSLLSAVIVE